MKLSFRLGCVLLLLLAVGSGTAMRGQFVCGGGGATGPLSIIPSTTAVLPGTTQQFISTASVTWSISSGPGAIGTSGLYTAPDSISQPTAVTIVATSTADSTQSASATVTVTPPPLCTLSLSSYNAVLPATGTSTGGFYTVPAATQSFTVTPGSACGSIGALAATSSNTSWLRIASVDTNAGVVSFQALSSSQSSARTAVITVSAGGAASSSFTVFESADFETLLPRQVRALYQQLLGREPDSAGFAFWTGAGAQQLGLMADAFLTSYEGQTYNFQVVLLYKALLNRFPTYNEAAAGLAAIRPPALPPAQTALFTSVLGSSEYVGNYGTFNNTNFVYNLYVNLLGRAPTAPEMNAAVNGLAGGSVTPYGIFSTLIAGAEFQNTGPYRTAPDHTNAAYVDAPYLLILQRVPDPSGFAFWLGVANAGGPGIYYNGLATRIQILGTGVAFQGFIGSAEFQCAFQ